MHPHRAAAPDRRLSGLAAAAVLALAIGAIVGAVTGGDDPPTPPNDPSSSGMTQGSKSQDPASPPLSLRQQVGQSLILSFEGQAVPQEVAEALEAGEVAGVVLFAGNVESRAQVHELTDELQGAAGGSALISVDQEGGAVRIIPFAPPPAGQAAQATPADARSTALDTAEELRALGVNVNLAPVADVPLGPAPALRDRAYPGDARQVAALVRSAVAGYREAGVAATVKHFPGLGAATRNTDDATVTLERTRDELDGVELEPFRAAIRADAPLLMASHARYPAYDRRHIASQSSFVLGDLLRGRLGFRGAVVTDSLEAEASLRASSASVTEAGVRSLAAGADLLLLTGDASYGAVFERVLARAERSAAFRARVGEASDRVLELKERLGLRPPALTRAGPSGGSAPRSR